MEPRGTIRRTPQKDELLLSFRATARNLQINERLTLIWRSLPLVEMTLKNYE